MAAAVLEVQLPQARPCAVPRAKRGALNTLRQVVVVARLAAAQSVSQTSRPASPPRPCGVVEAATVRRSAFVVSVRRRP